MPTDLDRNDALEILRGCRAVAPDGPTQEAFTAVFNQMEGAGESYRYIAMTLAQSAIDGMKHGNWPTMPGSGAGING